ncbi:MULTISPECIES: hypothetical protein [Pseudoalteromonas]|uniref:Uncharacterized protein n=1 Tax=Pseudoalteromonas aurantia 208 TaxID=1314867 RepID=A0ABR9E9G4_9GAMM|nr:MULTISPECIES: hypothetical protein [Pseudoalteromonas]MBE0366890.1 hypothetical protein [Pseudoalteromonas aurantia 208]MBQ4852135.1 hypothetical protein [Pseudoalteromonas sp. MMG012]
MHPLHAEVLEITPLRLKQADHTGTGSNTQTVLTLNPQLLSDIQLADSLIDLSVIYQGADVGITEKHLLLPSAQLNSQQKRQLWKLLSEY